MQIAYLGYDLLSPCLTALSEGGYTVMEVFSFPTDNEFEFNREVSGFAQRQGIPYTEKRIQLEDIYRLKEAGCEAIFCAGYLYRVPVDHSVPMVNVHPALLPVGRGAWPMPVTILRGMRESGVTLHKMEADFDTGDILLQRAVPVEPEETLETLTEKLRDAGAELCRQMAADFDRLWAAGWPQGPGEYWPDPQKPDYTITWRTPPQETDCILRAFFGYECFLQQGEQEHRIVRGRFFPKEHRRPFGTVEQCPGGGRRFFVNGGVIEEPPALSKHP